MLDYRPHYGWKTLLNFAHGNKVRKALFALKGKNMKLNHIKRWKESMEAANHFTKMIVKEIIVNLT